jgi:hypothetical protein
MEISSNLEWFLNYEEEIAVNEIDKIKTQVARDTQKEVNAGREINPKPTKKVIFKEVEGIKLENVPGSRKKG